MPRVSSKKFFTEQSIQSRVKAEIISKYVSAWARIVLSFQKKRGHVAPVAAYIDLFSGPGTYEDNNKSTPLLVVEEAIKYPLVYNGLRAIFNDNTPTHIESLEQEIKTVENISTLKYPPSYFMENASIALIDKFDISSDVPQFFFLDQFGYSDVKPDLIRRVFHARMCDCAFFFKYSRVVAALSNPEASSNMEELFGKDAVDILRQQVRISRGQKQKERLVLAALEKTMKSVGATFFHAFAFRVQEAGGARHHLIYLGKHERGLTLMKEIMGNASTRKEDGVPIFGFAEVEEHPNLFSVSPIDNLKSELVEEFTAKTLTVASIYSRHHVGKDYLLKNYQEALRRLESDGSIVAEPSAGNRPQRHGVVTMGLDTRITFPAKVETL
jgi:three-Cys-motif partner protein